MIKQSSGEDWKSTKVSLSTATPSKGGSPPVLKPNNISIYRPPPPPQMFVRQSCEMATSAFSVPSFFGGKQFRSASIYDTMPVPMRLVEEQKVTLHSTQFIQRFDTARPATIPSDGTEHKVNSILCGTNT